MSRKKLAEYLKQEMARWEAKPYHELVGLTYPLVYENGSPGEADYYGTEVCFLEKDDKQIHLSISVDDGGLSAFVPVSSSIIVLSVGLTA